MWFKRNKYIILLIVILFAIAIKSTYDLLKDQFGYAKGYYEIKRVCYEKRDLSNEKCKYYPTEEYLERYIKNFDPKEDFKRYDAISFTYGVVEYTNFGALQWFSPLLIIFALVFTIHSDLNSGNFKNKLLRQDFKEYKKSIRKKIYLVSLSTPLTLVFVFLISCLITRFNFNYNPADTPIANDLYTVFRYDYFIVYGAVICLIQFLINILYCDIGLYACFKNKNSFVATIMGYILFIVVNLFIYIVLYCFIINKILGFHELTDYFNISGYWFFRSTPECFGSMALAFIFQFLSSLYIWHLFKDKEKVVIAYENQNA